MQRPLVGMTGRFQLRLFGQAELRDSEGRAVAFRTRKQLAVLVYLYLEARERGADRDLLVELLWSDVPAENGRHSLSQACTAIRERLGEDAIERRGDQLRLVAPLVTDLDLVASEDNRLLDLTQPLRELDRAGSVEFAHWVERARVEVMRRARVALFEALKSARARGDLQAAYRSAHLLLQLDPTCALAVQVVAERTLLDGDTIGAIRTLRDYLQCVERELGANPHPEITRLLGRLERGEGPPLLGEHVRGVHVVSRPEVFVGRERELASLESLWVNMAEVSYQACLITGPAGIGKSALLRRFATRVAARACPVFLVACQEIGQGIPFAAVSDLIRALVRDPSASGTDPRWLAEASRVSPGLRTTYPGIPEAPPAPADSVRVRVADALYHMLEAVAEDGPVLLAFDDMQHMDHASRDVLFLLTRRLEAVRVLLAATERRDDGRVVSPAPESRVLGFGWRQVIELDPLERAEAMQLVTGVAQSFGSIEEQIRDKIVSLGQGNPYYLEMLLADFRQYAADSLVVAEEMGRAPAPRWRPPETMRLAFARLYEGLSQDAQHILHILAVAGRALDVGEIVDLLALERTAADRAVLEIIESGAIRVEGDRFYFKNEIHRANVYWAMSPDARRYHHGRIARLLGVNEPHNFQRSLEASHHYVRAGARKQAIAAAITGAEVAISRGAPREAEAGMSTLLKAYPDVEEPRAHLLLATALVAVGRHREALERLTQWDQHSGSTPEVASAALLRAEALHRGRLAEDAEIGSAASRALEAARQASSERLVARGLQLVAEFASDMGDVELLERAGSEATALASASIEAETRALAGLTTGYCFLVLCEFEKGAQQFRDIVPQLRELGLKVELRRALNGLGMCDTAIASFPEAIASFRHALRVASQLGDRVTESNVWSNLGALYHDMGEYSAAVAACETAISLHGRASTSRVSVDPSVNSALLALDVGELNKAEGLLDLADQLANRSRLLQDRISVLLARAQCYLAKAEPEKAWPIVEEALAISRGRSHLGHVDLGLFHRLEAQYCLATQGRLRVEELAQEWRQNPRRLRLADELERWAYLEWADMKRTSPMGHALDELVDRRLFGRVGRLSTAVPGFLPRKERETTAQLIARVFPLASIEPDADAPGERSQIGARLRSS